MTNAIEIKDISVYYEQHCALDSVNMLVPDKDFLAIIGPNGGGKTTLLRTMLGLQSVSNGEIRLFGKILTGPSRDIGYVPQYSKFKRDFPITVEEVILMGRIHKQNPIFHHFDTNDRKIAAECMNKLEITDLAQRQIGYLSGGQIQRVLIARALAMQPKILLLDEPTASIDSNFKTHIYTLLKDLNKQMTIIMVTHDMAAVSSQVKHIACLNRTIYYHGDNELTDATLQKVYGCPVDLIAHGVPHRILRDHHHHPSHLEVNHD